MSDKLKDKQCKPCKKGDDPLKGEDLKKKYNQIDDNWKLVEEHHITREFKFDDFKGAHQFANRVASLAEQLDHHPEICYTWGKTNVTLWTHKIDGLSENDFIFAAKVDDF